MAELSFPSSPSMAALLAKATPSADFSGFTGAPDAYWKAQQEQLENKQKQSDFQYQQGLRNVFKDSNGNFDPTLLDSSGNPDAGKLYQRLLTVGGAPAADQAGSIATSALQQDRLRNAPAVEGAINPGQGQPSNLPPSTARLPSTPVAAPSNTGAPPQAQPASIKAPPLGAVNPQGGDQPGSLVGAISDAGFPPEQQGQMIGNIAKALGIANPNAPLDPSVAPRVAQVLQAAKARMTAQPPATTPQPQATGATAAQPQPVASGTDPTLGGLIPPGYQAGPYLQRLQAIAASGRVLPDQLKVLNDKIGAIQTALQPTPEMKNASAAGLPLLNYQGQNADTEARSKALAEADVKEQGTYIDAARAASQRLSTLNTISNIVNSDKNVPLGFGGEARQKLKMALEAAGLPVGDLSGGQVIEKLNAQLASEAAKTISPRPAQFEFKTFLANNPGLNLDKAGNIRVIGILSQLAKRDVDLGKLARQNRGNWQNWDNVVADYDKKPENQIKDPATGKPITTDSIVAPGAPKAPQQNKTSNGVSWSIQ